MIMRFAPAFVLFGLINACGQFISAVTDTDGGADAAPPARSAFFEADAAALASESREKDASCGEGEIYEHDDGFGHSFTSCYPITWLPGARALALQACTTFLEAEGLKGTCAESSVDAGACSGAIVASHPSSADYVTWFFSTAFRGRVVVSDTPSVACPYQPTERSWS